jgi:dipeptidyl-peptidase 4
MNRALRLAALALLLASPAAAQVDYARAEQLLTWNTASLITGDVVQPNWLPDGDRFWYRVTVPGGADFIIVDPVRNSRRHLFDNARLAAAMSLANDTAYAPGKLPFRTFDWVDVERAIAFNVGAKRFDCDIVAYRCAVGDTVPQRPISRTVSPDGRWEAFVHEHNLHIRPLAGGDSIPLTNDGVELWAYGAAAPRANQLLRNTPARPVLQWSPDSRRIAVARIDERQVEQFPIYSSTTQRPRGFTYPYALPGDSIIPVYDIHIVDVAARSNVRVNMPPQSAQVNGMSGMRDSTWIAVKWGGASDQIYFTHVTRGPQRVQLMRADARTGEVVLLARDSSATFVELNTESGGLPNWGVANGGRDVIWFSQRDGWGHLYRYDERGARTGRITEGAWVVGEVRRIDERDGRIWFTARGRESGRDPYFTRFYRVNLDGSGLTLLTPEDAEHIVHLSPSGRFFVDTYSRLDQPPVTVLRSSADGRVLRTLEEADVSALLAIGWRPPEPFTVKARDGVTELHGVIYRPTNFDPSKKYPVLDHIYPGPQIIVSPKSFFPTNQPGLTYATFGQVQAIAELGFIVVHLDHMGTNLRSKAFHDAYYGNMADHGLPDHVAALRQLGARFPSMDLERVGIYGHSGGAFASTAAILQYPDFFKVAVSTAGNHDNRSYYYGWGERYQGLLVRDSARGSDNYESQANYRLARNLRGRLFLMHGDMDDNVHPALTLRLVHALVEENKDFDLLILPDLAHGVTQEPYVIRRTWDYFVRHLLGAEPPHEYRIALPPTP